MSWGVEACRALPIRSHLSGPIGLAFAEAERDVPFPIERVYWLWGMARGDIRGEHAHKQLEQVYICLHGAVDVTLLDDQTTRQVRLDRPDQGLYLGHMVWRSVRAVADGSVLLVLASAPFDEADYFREQAPYLQAARLRRANAQGAAP
jgi:hypothetical protein